MKSKRILPLLMSSALTLGLMSSPVCAEDKLSTIYIAGDSTSCIYKYDDKYVVPRAGWGMYLDKFLDSDVEVKDYAKSGRSSKSFAAEDNYKELMDNLSEGDYLFIQFGHNDQKKSSEEDKANRYTSPDGDKDTEGSFKNSIYKNYIKPALDKKAHPVLLTPIPRYKFNEDGTVNDSHGEYDDAIRELAAELNLPCLDITQFMSEIYNKNADNVSILHAIYADNKKGTNGLDTTHLNHLGGKVVACAVAANMLYNSSLSSLVAADEKNVMDLSCIYTITRAEFVDSLMRMLNKEVSAEGFSDVSDEEISKTLAAAKELGIAKGDGEGHFMPDRELTADELKAFTERFCEVSGLSADEYSKISASLNRTTVSENAYLTLLELYSDLNGQSETENQTDDQIEKVE